MKVTIEFEAKYPIDAEHALRCAAARIMFEFNPRQWKRPCVLEHVVFNGANEPPIGITIKLEETKP